MKELISKYAFPVILIIIGAALLYFGLSEGQNNRFLIGAASILGVGIISMLNASGAISKVIQYVLTGVLIIGAVSIAYLDYKSIKEPIEFMKEKKKRYAYVVQRLKDIRTAELAYKSVNDVYTNNFDTLINFVQNDSFPVIKAHGTVPDTLTEEKAVEMGIVSRDTSYISVQDSIFSKHDLKGREKPFYLDSIPYIPYTGGAKFKLEAKVIDRGNVKVPVFKATDTKPFDPDHQLKVGSLQDPSTSGNWE